MVYVCALQWKRGKFIVQRTRVLEDFYFDGKRIP